MQWRTEPGYAVKCLDDLWLAVKCQSNSEIAGSPRNSFRASVVLVIIRGRALKRFGAGNGTHPYQTTNTGGVTTAVRTAGLSSSLKRETAQIIV